MGSDQPPMEEVDGNHVVFISGRWILDDLEVTGWNMLEPMEPEKISNAMFLHFVCFNGV